MLFWWSEIKRRNSDVKSFTLHCADLAMVPLHLVDWIFISVIVSDRKRCFWPRGSGLGQQDHSAQGVHLITWSWGWPRGSKPIRKFELLPKQYVMKKVNWKKMVWGGSLGKHFSCCYVWYQSLKSTYNLLRQSITYGFFHNDSFIQPLIFTQVQTLKVILT